VEERKIFTERKKFERKSKGICENINEGSGKLRDYVVKARHQCRGITQAWKRNHRRMQKVEKPGNMARRIAPLSFLLRKNHS
jgi:hypothetical protein